MRVYVEPVDMALLDDLFIDASVGVTLTMRSGWPFVAI